MQLTIRPLTPDQWPALEDLIADNRTCQKCWCMYWRIGAAYRNTPAAQNRNAFHRIVAGGPPPGLLAFEGKQAVGWCQLTPRSELPHLNRQWRLESVDNQPVWSISCFYIRKGYRRKGVTSALIAAAIKTAKKAKAPALEAYPLDASKTPSSSSTGFMTTFTRAGFKVVACNFPPRPIMRFDLLANQDS